MFCAPALGEVRISADRLDRLPPGVVVHKGVKAVPDGNGLAILFSEGGITLPTAGRLTAGAGTIDLRCQAPEASPGGRERTLFFAGGEPNAQVLLALRDGGLVGTYAGADGRPASVRFGSARLWQPQTWHRVQLSWRADGKDVELLLCVDGQLVATATGRLIENWPASCQLGARGQESPWQGLLNDVVLSAAPLEAPELAPGRRTVTVRADQAVGECYNFWSVGNFNKPHLFLDPNFRREAPWTGPFVKQVNAVYLLGGRYEDQNRWFLGVGPDGNVRTDFTGMIAQLRAMQEWGYVPWIVLDNVPYNMSDPPSRNFYGNTAPPKDERVWGLYVEAAVREMVKAFGRATVGKWWFRVGTEPDLRPAHWAGTKEQYLAHYDHTVEAMTRALPEAKIGPGNILNPSAAGQGKRFGQQWGLDVIDHAATGRNYCTGKVGTRLDWFSCSWYGRVGGSISNFDHAIEAIRKRLDRYEQFAKVPIAVGEHAVLGDEQGRRLYAGDTTEWSASFYAALADRVYAHGVVQVYEWDHATFGVLHPKGHAIGMLERMTGGRRLAVEADGNSAAQCGAVAAAKDGRVLVLLYNHRAWRRPKVAEAVHLVVRDARMKAGKTWRLSEWVIDAERTVWAYAFDADCRAAGLRPVPGSGLYEGSPERYYGPAGEALFLKNIDKYRKLAELPQTRREEPLVVQEGQASLDFDMPGHSVRLLELTPRE